MKRDSDINPIEIRRRLVTGFRDKGYKLTPQRLEIVDILSRDRNHPSAQNVFKKKKKHVPKISMSTVYYTLN